MRRRDLLLYFFTFLILSLNLFADPLTKPTSFSKDLYKDQMLEGNYSDQIQHPDDFLGFGLPPGSASLGEMVNQGRNNLQAPWLGLTSFFTLGLMLGLLVFIGEAVRDALDPRKTFN